MDFVKDSNTCNKHEAKHKTVFINLKITLAINEFIPDDLMKTGHFGCVFIQELLFHNHYSVNILSLYF